MTPLERLKALAAAKKGGTPNAVAKLPEQVSQPEEVSGVREAEVEQAVQVPEVSSVSESKALVAPADLPDTSAATEIVATQKEPSRTEDHPLLMELAELEAALTERLPSFRSVLRDIHSKLRNDPAIVTILSDEDIGLIVSGMMVHANQDVVAPKAVKAAKATKKIPLSADDL